MSCIGFHYWLICIPVYMYVLFHGLQRNMLYFDFLISRLREEEACWWEDVDDKLPCKSTVPI